MRASSERHEAPRRCKYHLIADLHVCSIQAAARARQLCTRRRHTRAQDVLTIALFPSTNTSSRHLRAPRRARHNVISKQRCRVRTTPACSGDRGPRFQSKFISTCRSTLSKKRPIGCRLQTRSRSTAFCRLLHSYVSIYSNQATRMLFPSHRATNQRSNTANPLPPICCEEAHRRIAPETCRRKCYITPPYIQWCLIKCN